MPDPAVAAMQAAFDALTPEQLRKLSIYMQGCHPASFEAALDYVTQGFPR